MCVFTISSSLLKQKLKVQILDRIVNHTYSLCFNCFLFVGGGALSACGILKIATNLSRARCPFTIAYM